MSAPLSWEEHGARLSKPFAQDVAKIAGTAFSRKSKIESSRLRHALEGEIATAGDIETFERASEAQREDFRGDKKPFRTTYYKFSYFRLYFLICSLYVPIMPENFASAGDGPAPSQPLVSQEVSDSARIRGALAACESLLGDCARVASDREETGAAQMLAAATAAKLASAAALAASAIARLEEAQTHRELAAAKIDITRASQNASPRRVQRRVSATRDVPAYDADDWRAYSDDDEESTNIPKENEWPE